MRSNFAFFALVVGLPNGKFCRFLLVMGLPKGTERVNCISLRNANYIMLMSYLVFC